MKKAFFKYYFMVPACIGIFLIAFSNTGRGQAYCIPKFTAGCAQGDSLSLFKFGSLSTVPGCHNKGSDTSHLPGSILTVYRGRTYPLVVYHKSMNKVNAFNPDYTFAFVDYNKNGSFSDSGDCVAMGCNINTNITIPLNTKPQTTRMRVMDVSQNCDNIGLAIGFIGACGTFDDNSVKAFGGAFTDYNITIGAYQNDIGVSLLLYPQNDISCLSTNTFVKVILTNYGTSDASKFPVVLKFGSLTISNTYNRNLAAATTDTFTVGSFNTSTSGIYKFDVYTNLNGDGDRTNDTFHSSVNIRQPIAPKVDSIYHCGPAHNYYLHGASTSPGSTTYWYDSASSDSVIFKGDSLSIPYLAAGKTTFYAESHYPDTASILKGLGYSNSSNSPVTQIVAFDMIPKKDLTVDSFDICMTANSTVEYVNAYYRVGTSYGTILNLEDWIPLGRIKVKTKGPYYSTRLQLPQVNGIQLPFGNSYGFYLSSTSGFIVDTLNVLSSGNKDITIQTAFGRSVSTVKISPDNWTGKVYYHYEACHSPRLASTVNIINGAQGAYFSKGSNFGGQYNTGEIDKPDNACIGTSNTYIINPPPGYNNKDYGIKWTIASISAKTPSGTVSNDTAFIPPKGNNNGQVIFSPTQYADSIFLLKVQIKILGSGCDSVMLRYIHISTVPTVKFGYQNACLGNPVIFADSSNTAISKVSQWSWDFGDGNTSIFQNPRYSYYLPGAYKTTLTATTADGCSNKAVNSLTILDRPRANFYDVIACTKYPVSFINNSKFSTGILAGSFWNYGDANSGSLDTSSSKNGSHAFLKSGNYTIKLIITASNGCKDSSIQKVKVLPTPIAAFAITSGCVRTPIYLQNNSIDSLSGTGYNWDFGNGESSSLATAAVIYSANGTYKILLTVNSQNGCFDTLSKLVSPYSLPNAGLLISNGCTGATTTLTDTINAGKNANYTWDFGDGPPLTTTNTPSVKHSYATAGSYDCELFVVNDHGCSDTLLHTFNIIDNPAASFKVNAVCLGKPSVFTNTSKGTVPLAFRWDFADPASIGSGNDSSSLTNTTHVYAVAGTYNPVLMATNANGCKSTATQTVTVKPAPVIAPWQIFKHGYQVNFTPADSNIGKFEWHFGTKNNDSSSLKSPVFIYPTQNAGYLVRLVVTNSSGCSSTLSDSISVSQSSIESVSNSINEISVSPNPFEGFTSIHYQLISPGKINISIYDVQGKLIAKLRDGFYSAGAFTDIFDAKKYDAPGGIYFLKMQVNGLSYNAKLVEMR